MTRRIALVLVLAAGVFWLASTFAFDYPAKTQAVDNLTNAFRPAFSNAGIKQEQTDIATVDQFAAQFQTKAVPALAQELHLTPAQFLGVLSKQYPAVGAGIQQLPTSLPYFDKLVAGLGAQQGNFHKADALPTKSLPTTTVHWMFVILGIFAIGLAGLGLLARPPWAGRILAVTAVFGLAVIAVSLILSIPSKTKAVDGLSNAFRPVFTTQAAAQTRSYLTTVEAMDKQLNADALPGLAKLLNVTPDQLEASLKQAFPAVATGLVDMPQILNRFDGLVSDIEHNVHNFQVAESIPTKGTHTTAVEDQLAVPAGVLVIAGVIGLGVPMLATRRRARSPQTSRGQLAGVGT